MSYHAADKKVKRYENVPLYQLNIKYILLFLHCCEALAAIYGSVAVGLERNLCFLTTVSTNSCEHLTRRLTRILTEIAASLTSLGLVLESFLCIELLLACGKDKFLSAIFALKGLVLVHWYYLT